MGTEYSDFSLLSLLTIVVHMTMDMKCKVLVLIAAYLVHRPLSSRFQDLLCCYAQFSAGLHSCCRHPLHRGTRILLVQNRSENS